MYLPAQKSINVYFDLLEAVDSPAPGRCACNLGISNRDNFTLCPYTIKTVNGPLIFS